jgi:hypothetical protein
LQLLHKHKEREVHVRGVGGRVQDLCPAILSSSVFSIRVPKTRGGCTEVCCARAANVECIFANGGVSGQVEVRLVAAATASGALFFLLRIKSFVAKRKRIYVQATTVLQIQGCHRLWCLAVVLGLV